MFGRKKVKDRKTAKTKKPSSSAGKTTSGTQRATTRKATAKKKTTTGRAAPKKATTRKPSPKKTTAKKKSAPKKKTVAKKTAAKKTPKKSATARTTTRKAAPKRKVAAKKPTTRKKPATNKKPAKTVSGKSTIAAKARSKVAPPVKPPFESYKGSKPYIFTSYAHRNMGDVFDIIKELNKSRYRVWYDEGIEPGNEWPEIVGKAVLGCSQFLVFMSSAAAKSRNVRNEINLAFSEEKDILVIFLEKANMTEGMKLQIGTVQFINRYEMKEGEFLEKLKKVLNSDLRS